MEESGSMQFETAIGRMGIRWSSRGVAAIRWSVAGEPVGRIDSPRWVRAAVDGIASLLDGDGAELSSVPLDFDGVDPVDRSVYEAARRITPGETRTYGQLARAVGEPDARRVGVALARNRFPIVVPCHRVVAADGGLGGFSAPGGLVTKRRLLAIERVYADQSQTLFGAR
jgi:methylated-DNA-[protein]-cysteine S-methyltransferase